MDDAGYKDKIVIELKDSDKDKIMIELKDGMKYKGYMEAEFPNINLLLANEMTGINVLYFNKNFENINANITFHLFYHTIRFVIYNTFLKFCYF